MQKSKSFLSTMLATALAMATPASIVRARKDIADDLVKDRRSQPKKKPKVVGNECATSRSKVYPGCASHIPHYATPTNYHPR